MPCPRASSLAPKPMNASLARGPAIAVNLSSAAVIVCSHGPGEQRVAVACAANQVFTLLAGVVNLAPFVYSRKPVQSGRVE
jgi:hypothetical protein